MIRTRYLGKTSKKTEGEHGEEMRSGDSRRDKILKLIMAFKFLTDYSHEEVAAKRQRQEIRAMHEDLKQLRGEIKKASRMIVVRGWGWLSYVNERVGDALDSGQSADTRYSYGRTR